MITEKMSLDYSQQKSLDDMLAGQNCMLTGPGGCGKSHVAKLFINNYKGNLAVLAPTGMAAKLIGGVTIHSFFHLRDSVFNPHQSYIHSYEQVKIIRETDCFLIDEVSFLRSDLFSMLDRLMREVTEEDKPWGGKQIVVLGDFLQLPPIVAGEFTSKFIHSNFEGRFAFQTNAWRSLNFKIHHFNNSYRQQGEPILTNLLNCLRLGNVYDCIFPDYRHPDAPPIDFIEAANLYIPIRPNAMPGQTILCSTNRRAEEINETTDKLLGGQVFTFLAEKSGVVDMRNVSAPEELRLRFNSRIVLLANGISLEGVQFFNGDQGNVVGFEVGVIRVKLDSGLVVSIKQFADPQERYCLKKVIGEEKEMLCKQVVGIYKQFHLKKATALSIHKAQGSSIPYLFVDLGSRLFDYAHLYVALSRARSITNLCLSRPLTHDDIRTSPDALGFYEREDNSEFQYQAQPSSVAMDVHLFGEPVDSWGSHVNLPNGHQSYWRN